MRKMFTFKYNYSHIFGILLSIDWCTVAWFWINLYTIYFSNYYNYTISDRDGKCALLMTTRHLRSKRNLDTIDHMQLYNFFIGVIIQTTLWISACDSKPHFYTILCGPVQCKKNNAWFSRGNCHITTNICHNSQRILRENPHIILQCI